MRASFPPISVEEAWQYDYINGKLATLRWVLDSERDFLDPQQVRPQASSLRWPGTCNGRKQARDESDRIAEYGRLLPRATALQVSAQIIHSGVASAIR
jgi:hypothetical protein